MNYNRIRETQPKFKRSVGFFKNRAWRQKVKKYFRVQRNQCYQKLAFAKQHLSVFSDENIKNPTIAEIKFESILQSFNIPYKKQPFFSKLKSSYIPDFVLDHPYYLIIEVDGEYHKTFKQRDYDIKRDRIFGLRGYKTIRFANQEVFENPAMVRNKLEFEIVQQKKWNCNCKSRKSIFRGGVLSAIKPTKPLKATQDCSILAENPSL